MEWGICFGETDTTAIAAAGYDYVEHPAARLLDVSLSDDEWAPVRDRILGAALPVPVCNLFFPGDMKLVGPDRDPGRAVAYADRLFGRLVAIGATIQVFGSGGARRVPEGYPPEKAAEELQDLAARIGPLAARHGVCVAMEHLRAAECNILTTLEETLRFVREVNHPAVKVLADGFHLAQMDEPYEGVRACGDLLVHVHVADPDTRHEPAAEGSDLRPLFRELKAAGYDARVSVECRWQDMAANLGATRDLLAAQWDEV